MLSQPDLRVLWDAWFAYAPPDAQVALDAAKLRGGDWALCEYPPYVKYYPTIGCYRYVVISGSYQIASPVLPEEAEYYAQGVCAIKCGYSNWKEAILGKQTL